MQCVVKDDEATGKRVVAGTHWDFDSYGGTIKKQMGMPTQVSLCFLSYTVLNLLGDGLVPMAPSLVLSRLVPHSA